MYTSLCHLLPGDWAFRTTSVQTSQSRCYFAQFTTPKKSVLFITFYDRVRESQSGSVVPTQFPVLFFSKDN